MAILNKVYYQFKLVKAFKEHECFTSKTVINKGDYYVHLMVDAGTPRTGKYGDLYTPTSTFRFSLMTFATTDPTQLLMSTKLFGPDNDELVIKLKGQIKILTETIRILAEKE